MDNSLDTSPANFGQQAKKLWATVTAAIKGLPKTDSALLTSIQDLIVSGLTSRHQAILNQSIELWNCTFGKADFLEYRDDLRTALIKLRSVTEMQLPNFPADDPEVSISSLCRESFAHITDGSRLCHHQFISSSLKLTKTTCIAPSPENSENGTRCRGTRLRSHLQPLYLNCQQILGKAQHGGQRKSRNQKRLPRLACVITIHRFTLLPSHHRRLLLPS